MDNIKIIIETPVGVGNASCEFRVNDEVALFSDMTMEQKNYTIEAMKNFALLFAKSK